MDFICKENSKVFNFQIYFEKRLRKTLKRVEYDYAAHVKSVQ